MKPMFGGISRGRGEASSPEVPFRVPSEYHEPEEYHATIRAQHTAPDHSTMRYTAARATRALRVPLTCIGRSRRLGASVPWGAPSAGASSARCARLRRASWPPPPAGSKAVGDFAGGGLAHVPSTARGGRSGRPAGIGLTCALPWERAGQVQPGVQSCQVRPRSGGAGDELGHGHGYCQGCAL